MQNSGSSSVHDELRVLCALVRSCICIMHTHLLELVYSPGQTQDRTNSMILQGNDAGLSDGRQETLSPYCSGDRSFL